MDLNDLYKVWEVKPLKKPGEGEARSMLERIAKQVQPIMRRHKWKVKLLCEFCPTNQALLGLNVGGGATVKLRLRRPGRDWDFLPYEQVLDTMLHELCHNEHGPHNAAFYRLWDDLRKECEDLINRGVSGTGQGFDLPGRRLGGFSRQPPLSDLRQTALAAAEKRQRIGQLLPSGPKRLGGDSYIMTALSPIQAAAMAAERRMHDDLWCGSVCGEPSTSTFDASCKTETLGASEPVVSFTTSSVGYGKRPFDAVSKKKENSLKDQKNQLPLGGFNGVKTDRMSSATDPCMDNAVSSVNRSHESVNHGSSSSRVGAHTLLDQANWECGVCTLINKPLSLICEACGIRRPKDSASKFDVWVCKFCTLDNSTSSEKCSACEQWRYSYGAPPSTHGPRLET